MKKNHIDLSMMNRRRDFTAIVKGRRHVYFPCTQYYLRRLCEVVGIHFEVKEWKTIGLHGRGGRYVFKVEDIYIKDIDGFPNFKIYLGDVIESEHFDEHRKREH